MPRPIIFLLIFLSSLAAFGQKSREENDAIHWLTFEQAVALNKKEPRKMFIDVYTTWCKWCKVMDQKTFENKKIIGYMNTHYYCVKFDAESMDTVHFMGTALYNTPGHKKHKNTHQLASALLEGHLAYPSLVFMDENNQRITYLQSYLQPQDFEPYMKFFGDDTYKTKKFEAYYKDFKSEL